MQDKIIAAIEKALNENLNHTYIGYEINLQEIATVIAAAIAPLVEAGEPDWENAPEWAEWRTFDNDGDVTFWEYRPTCSLLGIWLQSSDGGRFTTFSPNRDLQQRPQ